MRQLIDKVREEAVHVAGGIIDVDSFLNHEVDVDLMMAIGAEFAKRFNALDIEYPTKIVTAEVSGIAPAFATAFAYGAPLVYVRKHKPITWPDYIVATAPSPTHGGMIKLMMALGRLCEDDKVLIIDDFLWTGATISAVARLILMSKAKLLGIGCVIEKPAGMGRINLMERNVPIVSLAVVKVLGNKIYVEEGR